MNRANITAGKAVAHAYLPAVGYDDDLIFKITFPMISPVVFFNVLMAIIKGLQIFTQPYVMTQGGPAQSTYVYGLYLYNTAFSYGKFGYASSLAWVLFVIIIVITMVIMKTSNSWVFYREDVK